MEFSQVVRSRRMVRRYTDQAVDPAVVDTALAHAVRAPNAGFSQGWSFLVCDTPQDVERFWRATSPDPTARNRWLDGMRTAPVVIVPLASQTAYVERYAEPDKGWTDRDPARWVAPYWYIDTGMAALLVLLTAVDQGLGGCFFGVPPSKVSCLRAEFDIPEEWAPIGAITLGHPAAGDPHGSPTRRARRPVADVVHRGNWQG